MYRVELDVDGNFVDIRNLRFERKVADVLLGVQRGVDVYFRFDSKENQVNERCFHFSGVTAPWGDDKCFEKVIEKIEAEKKIVTEIAYLPKEEILI